MQARKVVFLRSVAPLVLLLFMPSLGWTQGGADKQAGKAKAAQCATCHGMDGIAKAPDAPNLAGQNESYLVKALGDFKSGARKHEVMSMMAQNLSPADIAQLAAYYNSIPIVVKGP